MRVSPKEVRLGNWVDTDQHGYGVVTLIRKNVPPDYTIGVTCSPLENYVYTNPNAQAIPITAEILEKKFGFEPCKDGWYKKQYFTSCKETVEIVEIQINVHTGRCGVMDVQNEDSSFAMTANPILYVHKLQNYVFETSGEEPEFQLNK